MFTGLTVAQLLSDASDIGAIFAVPLTVAAVYWAGGKLLRMAKGFFGA